MALKYIETILYPFTAQLGTFDVNHKLNFIKDSTLYFYRGLQTALFAKESGENLQSDSSEWLA